MASGGSRPGSGRKKGITTKPVRVPSDIYYFVKILSKAVRESPQDYDYLFDSDRACYMLDCLSSNPPLGLVNAAARFKKKNKKNKK